MRRFFSMLAATLVAGSTAFAQYTNVLENATTQMVDSVWNLGSTNLWVGDLTSDNVLYVSDGGVVGSGIGIIGNTTNANYNAVVVSGSNAVLALGGALTVGWNGSGNGMEVLAGGGVTNQDAYVGQAATASSNAVTVSGTGSHWINLGSLNVGAVSNAGNSVSVSLGGTIQAESLVVASNNTFNLNRAGTLAMTDGFNASMNGFNWKAGGTLSVGGALTGLATTNAGDYLAGEKNLVLNGGTFSTATNLVVGYESSGNTLAITNGGGVANANGYIGWGTNAANNAVLVSGAGSAWTNSGNLHVGVYGTNLATAGTGNSLTVSNNAWVFVGEVSTNDIASSLGGIAVGSTNTASMVVGSGANVIAEQMYVGGTNGNLIGDVSVWSGGTMMLGGLNILNTNSAFNLEGTLTMTGVFDAGQTNFNWKDGGTLTMNESLTFNQSLGGSNKTLNVDGGSWSRVGNVQVDGVGNTLAISNGGHVSGSADGYIGTTAISSGNAVSVDGAGSVLDIGSGNLVVGLFGSSNSLAITSGGSVTNVNGLVGVLAGSSNNSVVVAGDGSRWINTANLVIGSDGASTGNVVSVADGGTIRAAAMQVAADSIFNLNANGTLALSSGFDVALQSNVNWNADGHLSVGGLLSGMDVATNLPMADAVYLNGGRDLTLDGGSWLNGDTNLIVGLNSSGSRLAITNGGTVDNADGYIGWGYGSADNSVLVGSGSAWTNHGGGLYVGQWLDADTNLASAGSGNTLTVQNGGWVFVGETGTNGLPSGASGGLLVASTNGAELVVGGNGSKVTVEQNLYVGVDETATGTVSVASGGTISVGELLIATNSTFTLNGKLEVTGTLDASQEGFIWNNGGGLSIRGSLTGLDALNGTNRTVGIDGGTWNTTATNLYITGSGNTLSITEGGKVYSASAFIGVSSNDVGNTVSVSGSGSEWSLTNLVVNPGNTLALESNGLVSVAGNMTVSNASVAGSGTVELGGAASLLSIYGTNTQLSASVLFNGGGGAVAFTDGELGVSGSLSNRFVNFDRLSLTNSTLGGTGMVDGFNNVNMSGGWIKPTGELFVDGVFAADGTILQVAVGAGSNQLHIASGLDLATMGAEVVVLDGLNPLGFSQTILLADGGITNTFNADISSITEHYMLYDFALVTNATTVSVESEAAVDGQISSAVSYAALQGVRSGFNAMRNSLFGRTQQLRRNRVATDNAIPQEAYLMSQTNAPSGAYGPGDRNTIFGMHFWAQQFNGQGDYTASGNTAGFVLNQYGTTFGFDRLFGDALVAGINYTYARSDAQADQGDRARTETYWLGLYGEWLHENGWYVDALAGVGRSNYDTERFEVGYRGTGSYRGSDFAGTVDAGRYLKFGDWALAPYAGLRYLSVQSDGYTENEAYGNPLEVGGLDAASLESAFGVKLRNRLDTRHGRFQTVGYMEWLFDFINDDASTTLSDGITTVQTAGISPDANLLNAGIGIGWICTDYMEIGIGYDGHFNSKYTEHTGSVMLDIRF